MSEELEKVLGIVDDFSGATASEFVTCEADEKQIDDDTEYVTSKIKEWNEKSVALDKIIKQIDDKRNWIREDGLMGETDILLHKRIRIYTHGVIKRLRNKDDRSLEDKLNELKSNYRIYDQEELY